MCNELLSKINRCWNLEELYLLKNSEFRLTLDNINRYLESLEAGHRIMWAEKYLPKLAVLSSSFGIQSSVSLHLMGNYYPNILIVLIDTGYLFPETYCFIDKLKKQMRLNLYVFKSEISSAWQEARYGKLWEQGIDGIRQYNFINKIEPMHRALKTLKVRTWFAGARRQQACTRRKLPILTIQHGVFKFFPIVDWTNQQIHQYIEQHSLEYHPLWFQGYVSVGDVHTSSKWQPGMQEEETRFFGLQRECGLHVTD